MQFGGLWGNSSMLYLIISGEKDRVFHPRSGMNLYLKSGLPYADIDGRTTEIAKIFKACSKRLTDIEKEGTFSLTPQCDLL